jgi:hypothetical protein
MWLCVIDLCIKHQLNPYEKKTTGFMEKFNDTLIVISSYFPLLFTNLIASHDGKYNIGWYYMVVIGFLVGVNIVVVVISSYETLKKKISNLIKQRRHTKEIEE